MNTGRKLLGDALKAALPTWKIVTDSRTVDAVLSPGACVVYTSGRERVTHGNTDYLQDKIELYVITYLAADSAKLEDTLDDEFFAVLEVLESEDAFGWDSATRGTFDNKFPCWQFSATCLYKIESGE